MTNKNERESLFTPSSDNIDPNKRTESVDRGKYQRLVGRLMYLARIRLDFVYTLSIVSQFMHNPREQHMIQSFIF